MKPIQDHRTSRWYTHLFFENVEHLLAAGEKKVSTADLISLNGYHPHGIYHSTAMEWWGDISNIATPYDFIRSKKEKKLLPRSFEYFAQNGFTLQTVPMDMQLFEEFSALYEITTLTKPRAIRFNLNGLLKSNIESGKPVFLTGLFKNEKLESGLVFVMEKHDTIARVFYGAKKTFPTRGGVGGVLEFTLIEHCIANGVPLICHGSATNPTGFTSKAGVFEFKARYGFTAYPSKQWVTTFINNPAAAISDIIFVGISDNQVSYTVVSAEEDQESLKKKYLSKHVKSVVCLAPQQALEITNNFLESTYSKHD